MSAWEGLTPPYATIVVDPPWPYDDKPLGYQRERQKTKFLPYSTMTMQDIKTLPVDQLAAPGAHLYLWTTQRYLWDAKTIATWCWGWRIQSVLTWCKEPMGIGGGGAFTPTTEFMLFGRRPVGALIREAREARGWGRAQVHRAVRGGHPTGIVYRWEADDCYPTPDDWTKLREVLPRLYDLPDLPPDPVKTDTTWWQWKRGGNSEKPAAALDLVERVSPGPRVELFARRQRLGWDSWGHGFEWDGAA